MKTEVHHIEKARIYLEFLNRLAEASIPYSFGISKILWELSLFLPSGSYIENWKTYRRASVAAEEVRARVSATSELKKLLRFEHPLPLNVVYSRILSSHGVLSPQQVARLICEFPPVLVTRGEDEEITRRKLRSSGDPFERYKNIPLPFNLRGNCVIDI
jgi:hypothetical protein